jgi:type IV pilus assembly protein PilF
MTRIERFRFYKGVISHQLDKNWSLQIMQKRQLRRNIRQWIQSGGILACIILVCACATTGRQDHKREAETIRNLGEAYLQQGNYSLALKELLKAEALNSEDYYLQNDLGLAYYYKQRYEESIRHFKKALDLKSDFAPAMVGMGNTYFAQKNWDSAIEYYTRAKENLLYATPYFPLSNLGAVYFEKKDYQKSESYYLEALKLRPDFIAALRGLARTYLAMGRVSDAVATLEKAIEIAPEHAGLHFDLGKVYQLTGNPPKAIEEFQKVTLLSPHSPLADEAEKEIRMLK